MHKQRNYVKWMLKQKCFFLQETNKLWLIELENAMDIF